MTIQKSTLPENTCGPWSIQRFTVSENDADLHRLRCTISGFPHRAISAGTFTRLIHEDERDPMMSDTPAEMDDHREAVAMANGWCLVAGLGIGMVVEAMLRKVEVFKVTVVEIDEDVIELVAPHLEEKWGDRIEIIHADIYEWHHEVGQRYGTCWLDIWPSICEDNLPEMRHLKARFGKQSKWIGAWCQDDCKRRF